VKFGNDLPLEETALRKPLVSRRAALLAYPAPTRHDLVHSLDAQVREQVESAC
jgi:hypothetical protein